jgi:hypothetical protein
MWKSDVSADTAASPGDVWRVMADVDSWPTWNPGLTAAHLDGPLVTGATGTVTLARSGERPFTVHEVRGQSFFAYGGKVPGGQQRFWQRLESIGGGRTRVTLGHTIDGPLWPVFGILFGRVIRGYLPQAAKQLVANAERPPG